MTTASSRPEGAAGRARPPLLPGSGQPARPFLKWAGGKRQLLPQLRRFYPQRFGAYHEPFLGSGAVFFDLVKAGRLYKGCAQLTDVNADLAGCWLRLRDDPDAVIDRLRQLDAGYREAPETHYYRVRDELFNPGRAAVANGGAEAAERYTTALAAMFIYLNRTGFNGLFRLNSKGMYNVPRGRYANPRICDEDNLRRVAEALSKSAALVAQRPYAAVRETARSEDFVYLDPPYAPLSATARFTGYTPGGFDSADQQRLQQVVIALAAKGCHVLLSNSTAPEVAALYDGNADALRVGIRAYTVPARRPINSNAARRGAVLEYVITNVTPRAECA